MVEQICPDKWKEIFMKQSVDKCREINFCNLCVNKNVTHKFFRLSCSLKHSDVYMYFLWWTMIMKNYYMTVQNILPEEVQIFLQPKLHCPYHWVLIPWPMSSICLVEWFVASKTSAKNICSTSVFLAQCNIIWRLITRRNHPHGNQSNTATTNPCLDT